MAQAWCHLSPAKTGAAAPFELRPKSALSPRYPPDRITNIVTEQQSSVPSRPVNHAEFGARAACHEAAAARARTLAIALRRTVFMTFLLRRMGIRSKKTAITPDGMSSDPRVLGR